MTTNNTILATATALLIAAAMTSCSSSGSATSGNNGQNTQASTNQPGPSVPTTAAPDSTSIPVSFTYTDQDGYTFKVTGTVPQFPDAVVDPSNSKPGNTEIVASQAPISLTVENTTPQRDAPWVPTRLVPIYAVASDFCASYKYGTDGVLDSSFQPLHGIFGAKDPKATYCAGFPYDDSTTVQPDPQYDPAPLPVGESRPITYVADESASSIELAEGQEQPVIASLRKPLGWIIERYGYWGTAVIWKSPGFVELTATPNVCSGSQCASIPGTYVEAVQPGEKARAVILAPDGSCGGSIDVANFPVKINQSCSYFVVDNQIQTNLLPIDKGGDSSYSGEFEEDGTLILMAWGEVISLHKQG